MTTIATTHGEYTGRTVETIIRREYGRKATRSGNLIIEPAVTGGYSVLGTLIWTEVDGEVRYTN